MLSLNNIKSTSGSRKTSKRLGRGVGSGKGAMCGRGANGQNSRAGGGVPARFEGGQTPLFRRMPKLRGFSNAAFKKKYSLITFRDLELLAATGVTDIDKKVLLERGIIENERLAVKLIAKGELKSKINVKVDKASAGAVKAVEKASGKVEIIENSKA